MTTSSVELIIFLVLVLPVSYVIYLWTFDEIRNVGQHKLPYPPGPPETSLILGNKSEILTNAAWEKFAGWTNRYGNIIYLRNFRRRMVILNSIEDAVELFERRSRNFSSRPDTQMHKLMKYNLGTALREYGPGWQKHRRIYQQALKPDSVLEYRPIQTRKVHDMLLALLQTPDEFSRHLKTLTGAIVLSVMFGYEVKPKDDPFVKLVETTDPAFGDGANPKWLVNDFPVLGLIPSWFPGAGFKRYALNVGRHLGVEREETYNYVVNSPPSPESSHIPVIRRFLDSFNSLEDTQLLQQAGASAYGAGAATTQSTINVFIAEMLNNPDIQKKAQAEIDKVTRGDRLPDYNDQSALPYIQALVREVLRWVPIFPMGLPHVNISDDTYKGFYIPKGTSVYANVWAITRNAERYRDPHVFNPDRFLDASGELNDDDMSYVFGFGRRICPGRHLGTATVWLAVATILACFDIGRNKDKQGNELPPDVKYVGQGISRYIADPFKCTITPRSEATKKLILEASMKA